MTTLQVALTNVGLAHQNVNFLTPKIEKNPQISLSDVVIDLQKLNSWSEIPPKHPKARYFLKGLDVNRISFAKNGIQVVCFHSYDTQLEDLKFSTEIFTPKDVYEILKCYIYHPNTFGNGGNWEYLDN